MRKVIGKPNSVSPDASAGSAILQQWNFKQDCREGLVCLSQRSIGNRTDARLLQENCAKRADGSISALPRIAYDFSQIPILSETPQKVENQQIGKKLTLYADANDLRYGDISRHEHTNAGFEKSESRRQIKRAVDRLSNYFPDGNVLQHWQNMSEGKQLPADKIKEWFSQHGSAPPTVYVHHDEFADRLTTAQKADGITIGNHIYFGSSPVTPALMAHEMTHVVQANLPGAAVEVGMREREVANAETLFTQGLPFHVAFPGPVAEPMAHPAVRVLLRAGSWLLRRTTNAISKHIARHGRRIAGRAVHSIFRNPRAIRDLVSRTIREGIGLARKATRHGAEEVLEEGGVRVFRQATRTPGKFRYVVEKDFGRAIGTRGEKILRVIIDETGRLVTAFPVDRFMAVGLTAGAVTIFSEHAAGASERIRERIEAEENRPTDWVGEILDFLNPLSGGSLNEGEQLLLDIDSIINSTTEQVIREIEETEHVTLTPEQREAIRDLVQVGVGSPLELEDIEED